MFGIHELRADSKLRPQSSGVALRVEDSGGALGMLICRIVTRREALKELCRMCCFSVLSDF